ncbi:MAG: zinc protease [Tenuifilum sp.]|jgi:predicted Zn-dependent peptidase|uniref:M16 family metallopeptidase n=1 Tax=Tenuifilum sp. TaxID=2760880 RepID=UPI0024AAC132|nr:pitrilysin family protein [Tenuifilum sp.]MDI3527666.1 zinc protease [Tenuifilum sp.]
MIDFKRFRLENGLILLVHTDYSTPIAAVNLLYKVGAKHENPEKTGFAHLFEHLMFGGSVNIPVFDEPLERVGGENNAFTTNDLTNYYITVPVENIETALWLESDRMLSLAFSQKSLDVQKSVVIEEFNQRYLNQPYGDVWLNLRPLAYKVHPYRWPTIGMSVEHIQKATLDDVKEFFYGHYAPNNAILCIAGPIDDVKALELTKKWFGSIEPRNIDRKAIPKEPEQNEHRRLTLERDVPFNAIYMAFHMCNRMHPDFPVADLLSDLLSNGRSSRLYQRLVKEEQLFSSVNAYITGDVDEGLFVLTGQLYENTSFKMAEEALNQELEELKVKLVKTDELDKVKNKFEANFIFEQESVMVNALNLCYYEMLSDANLLNLELDRYNAVTAEDIKRVANQVFDVKNCSTVYYKSNLINEN